MGLVDELQESASEDDVLTVLRKARRLSAKLGVNDIAQWLKSEQSGYLDADSVPNYRIVPSSLCANTNGYIPAGFGMVQRGIIPLPDMGLGDAPTQHLVAPISEIMALIDELDKGNGAYSEFDARQSNAIKSKLHSTFPEILNQLSILMKLNETRIRDIPEQVKNMVLDWACELESAGVTGDGVSFTKGEKRAASTITFNIVGSTIGQLAGEGSNVKV